MITRTLNTIKCPWESLPDACQGPLPREVILVEIAENSPRIRQPAHGRSLQRLGGLRLTRRLHPSSWLSRAPIETRVRLEVTCLDLRSSPFTVLSQLMLYLGGGYGLNLGTRLAERYGISLIQRERYRDGSKG